MSISRRYRIKYENLDSATIQQTNDRIETHIRRIYDMVKQHHQNLVLTGSSALFIYLKALGLQDLLYELVDPSDVDLLVVYTDKHKPKFTPTNIGNFSPIQKTPESSLSYQDPSGKKFDLTYESAPIKTKIVSNLTLLDLEKLKEQYEEDKREADMKKIQIINQIISRGVNPTIVKDGPSFKTQQAPSIYRSSLSSVSRNLFDLGDDTPSSTPSNPFGNMGGGSYYKLANLAKLSNMKIN